VILPPYQHQGHGSALYKAIYEYVLSKPSISELTVEDPAEAFEDLRDRNDLAMLLGHAAFMSEGFGDGAVSHGGGRVKRTTARTAAQGRTKGKKATGGKLGPPADRAWLERWRKDLKIAGRQFHRLVEMLIQLHLNPTDARAAKAYRLQVKERLYRFNYEVLAQLEEKDRLEKLEETFQSVCEDYRRILAMLR
jgi:histone acetyltransferase 1